MSEREAFLKAIAANPADDTARLVFADWLDERDDPLGEFIRLQIQLDRKPKRPRSGTLVAREKELLKAHQAEWLGRLAAAERSRAFEPTFRRGFVDSATIHGRVVADYADDLRRQCPGLAELDVVGVRGHGRAIADAGLVALGMLCLEDWPFPADVEAIANSPHFSHLEVLGVWLGSVNDEAVCRILGAAALPALRRIELVQLAGGVDAFEQAGELDARADRLAALINSARGTPVASVYRPFAELLPLGPHVGWNLHGGTVPDGRQALVHAELNNGQGFCQVFYFDGGGHLLAGEELDLSGSLQRKPRYGGYDEAELFEHLGGRIGFRPGMIRVHEFDAEQVIPDCWTRIYKFDGDVYHFLENPDGEPDPHAESREIELESVRFWLRGGHFCITHGGDAAWADQSGEICST
jgi:uncharacterized protein (TIGR02996 family)